MTGGGQNTVQTTTQELAPEQRELLSSVIPVAKDFVANPPSQFPGSGVVGFNPLQQMGQQMTVEAARGLVPQVSNLTNQFFGATGGLGQTAQAAVNQGAQGSQQLQQILGSGAQLGNNVMSTLDPTLAFTAGQAGQTAGQVGGALQSGAAAAQPGLNFLMSPDILRPESNPYLQQATQAAIQPLVQQFQTQIMPQIANEAVAAGGFGGTRQQIAEGLAAQGLQRESGNIAANIYSQAYGQGLGALQGGIGLGQQQTGQQVQGLLGAGGLTQQAANQIMQGQLGGMGLQGDILGQLITGQLGGQAAQQAALQTAQQGLQGQLSGLQGAGNIFQQQLLPAQLISAVGEQRQALQQQQRTEQIQRYINEQLIPFAAAQDVASLAFGIPAGSSTSTAQTTGGSSILPFMQAGVGLAAALPALFALSDKRLKNFVRRVGKLSDGLTIYKYRLIGDPKDIRERIGLMAHEVKKLYPLAVIRGEDGFERVNYALVPTWQEKEI